MALPFDSAPPETPRHQFSDLQTMAEVVCNAAQQLPACDNMAEMVAQSDTGCTTALPLAVPSRSMPDRASRTHGSGEGSSTSVYLGKNGASFAARELLRRVGFHGKYSMSVSVYSCTMASEDAG